MTRHVSGAALATALLAFSATSACAPRSAPVDCAPATAASTFASENPFGGAVPQITDQADAYDGRFVISVDGQQPVTVVTTQIRPGENYNTARDRTFFAAQQDAAIAVPARAAPDMIGVLDQFHNKDGGNAVAYAVETNGKVVSFADRAGLAAIGMDGRVADFYEKAALTHVRLLNSGVDGEPAYFQQYRNPADRTADPAAADALFNRALAATNATLAARFGMQPVEPQQPVCDRDTAWQPTADNSGVPFVGERTNQDNKFPWGLLALAALGAGALYLLTRKQQSSAAAPVVVPVAPKKSHDFELLHALGEDGREVVVCRNNGYQSSDSDKIWVFERQPYETSLSAAAPKTIVTRKAIKARPIKEDGPFALVQGDTQSSFIRTQSVVRTREDQWAVTTGGEDLLERIESIVNLDMPDADKRKGVLAITARATKDADKARLPGMTGHAQPALVRKKGRIFGGFLGKRIVWKNRVATALAETADNMTVDGPQRMMRNISNTLFARGALEI